MNKRERSLASLVEEYRSSDIISTIEKAYSREISAFVPLEKVRFNPVSRKQFFEEKRLKELTESIKNNGMLSPLLVREKDGFYEVCGGYKRFYIAKKLHLKEVPVSIREISDELMIYMILSRGNKKLHDNILNKTYAYEILTKEYHVSRKDIALISKASVSQVTNILRLINLDEEVIIALKKSKISYGQARVLLGLDHQTQCEFLVKIINDRLSVREIENMVKMYKSPSPFQKNIEVFAKKYNCKVSITEKNLTLSFTSKEELDAYLKSLLNID